jgi:hypothetical protein
VTEVREVASFHSVDLQTVGSISLRQGRNQSLQVRAEREVLEQLKTEVRDGTLIIWSRWNIRKSDALEIIIEMESVKALSVSGSGKIKGENRIVTENLDLRISGSGDMNLMLEADSVDVKISGSGDMSLELESTTSNVRISGSGDVVLSGTTESLGTRISGSGSLSAFGLESRNASVRISGSGNCSVHVLDKLDVHVSGSGNVDYRGRPLVNLSGSGSGSVRSK